MPMDAQGNFRHNHESAKMHSEAAGKKYESATKSEPEAGGDHVEIHPHGDGTFHTMHHGEKVDHETHGHALIHAAKIHAEEGHSHFHGHHDGMAMRSHSVKAGEEPESREHEDVGGMHEHMDEAMGGAPEGQQEENQPAGAGLDGLY